MGAGAVALVVAAWAPAATGAGKLASSDPAGDAGTGFDMTLVTISNDDAGLITFRIDVPALATLPPDFSASVILDTDGRQEDPMTDWAIISNGTTAVMAPATPSGLGQFFSPRSLTTAFTPGAVTISVHRRDLDHARAFSFGVLLARLTAEGFDQANADEGPVDAGRPYLIKLPTRLAVRSPSLTPARPAAGARFQARVGVRDITYGPPGDPAEGGRVTCRFTVGGVKVTARGALDRQGRATCSGKAPAGATPGAALRGTLTYTLRNATVTRTFTGRVA